MPLFYAGLTWHRRHVFACLPIASRLTTRVQHPVHLSKNRMIPAAAELLKRYDMVNNVYGNLIDHKTKQPLFRADAREAVKRLRVHIAADCVGDPEGIPLYFQEGKDSSTGAPLYRCVRGTNDLEGYHLHMRMMTSWCISPEFAHLLLLEHNYRWNLRQAIKNRGLDPAVGGFYDQSVIEAVQVCLHLWISCSPFLVSCKFAETIAREQELFLYVLHPFLTSYRV